MSEQYTYRKLHPGLQEIRLLKILPDVAGKPLRVAIQHSSLLLRRLKTYETISYAWGDPARTGRVTIVGALSQSKHLSVPANTEAALRRLCLPGQPRTVWIDAVCINQEDLVERGQQVAIMGQIFSQSTGNLVYLGELEDQSMADRASRSLQSLYDDAKSKTDDFRTFWSMLTYSGVAWRPWGDDLPEDVDSNALNYFMDLPWFSRLWVFQEAILAPKNTAIFGSSHFDLLDILRALQWWASNESNRMLREASQALECITTLYVNLDKLCQPQAFDGVSSLGALLYTVSGFYCSEPRDRVFAILATTESTIRRALMPDYTKALAAILQSASRYAISEANDLWFLNPHHGPGDLEGAALASWVPIGRQYVKAGDPPRFASKFQACPALMVPIALDIPESNVLPLRGYMVDTIKSATSTCVLDLYYHSGLWKWLEEAARFYTDMRGHCSQAENVRGLAKLLCTDWVHARPYDELLEEVLGPIEDVAAHLLCSSANCKSWQTTTKATFDYVRFNKSVRPFFVRIKDRRVLRTHEGRIGLGPQVTQPGDIVVLLNGANVPHVLRPLENGQHQMVGQVYVQGIMWGEILEGLEDTEEEMFELV